MKLIQYNATILWKWYINRSAYLFHWTDCVKTEALSTILFSWGNTCLSFQTFVASLKSFWRTSALERFCLEYFSGKTDICGSKKFLKHPNNCLERNKICSSRWNFNNDIAKMWFNNVDWIDNNGKRIMRNVIHNIHVRSI